MLTPRNTLARRVTLALDAARIPVLVGGCGSGRTTVLRLLRERIGGRTAVQHIDVERTATTPERFLHAVTAVSPFPGSEATSRRGGFFVLNEEVVPSKVPVVCARIQKSWP